MRTNEIGGGPAVINPASYSFRSLVHEVVESRVFLKREVGCREERISMNEESVLHLLGTVFSLVFSLVCGCIWLAPFAYLYFRTKAAAERSYQSLLKKWAVENGWDIVHQKRCNFVSPWMFTRSGSQFVYYVAVARKEDLMRIRWAWVRCGGWLLGPKSDRIEVSWDGQWHQLPPPEPEQPSRQDNLLWDRWMDG
jgi:hypothetical protein